MSSKTSTFFYQQIIVGVIGGVVIGLTEVMAQISFAALIFSGELAAYISYGIGFLLFGAAAMCLVVAVLSSRPEMVSTSQDVPAAIFSVMAVTIMVAIPDNLDSAFHTLVTAIIITSVGSGVVFILMGRFKLGRLVRYIPFPVVVDSLRGPGGFWSSARWG